MRPGCEGLADNADLGIKTHLWLYHTLPRNLRIRLLRSRPSNKEKTQFTAIRQRPCMNRTMIPCPFGRYCPSAGLENFYPSLGPQTPTRHVNARSFRPPCIALSAAHFRTRPSSPRRLTRLACFLPRRTVYVHK